MRITWWGHATTTIEDNGTRLLTDPVLTSRIAHLRRRRGPSPLPEAGDCDAVLISHLHADHLHLTSLPLVSSDAALVVPRGAAKLIQQDCGKDVADRCIEVAAGNQVRIGRLDITAVTAAHDGRRLPWSAHEGPALGYRVEGSPSVWFAGDTDLYDDLAAEAGPVDLALVPVGGWGPSLGPGHLDPVRAAEAVRRVGARIAVPVHFGTFWPIGCDWLKPDLFLPPGSRFEAAMTALDPEVRVELLAPGESTEVVHR
ncbi:L-ascorbate metabolism protein UlaG (beta-lactamase superfamily) [Kribbella voronezhensis]|uniref:L-ascorbate metabolism protein UlaG (Beta-lactamase superfamily) n=1 Tax=Kribbella voronezhensis TaxID=2512212 RepID=A0A4R7T4M9_9ACTN|nr:MBL fold metallo-hydrolase [Kribbella voronezhensis]TDU86781.1 L-ascorbate metabolism protein UlaG (beta-lactamase superfamily) [Kribbella voronezhensis]